MPSLFNYPIDKDATYLLACSYGPDSMALFDMLLKADAKIVCCHINYHKRGEASDFEENSLRKYCEEHNVIFECLDARTLKEEGNFQEWARDVRYMFFSQMYVKYNAKGLFVAHQQDDMIETYILQRRRGRVSEYGMKEESYNRGMKVIRPLLKYKKGELAFYDRENKVPFSIDASNFEDKYTRNQIRHEIISKMSETDRELYIDQIKRDNNELAEIKRELLHKVDIEDTLDIRALIALDNLEFREAVIHFVELSGKHADISQGQLDEIRKMCLSKKPNLVMKLADGLYLVREYDILVTVDSLDTEAYSYTMEKPGKLDTPYFEIDFTNGAEDRKIYESSYPLTIRNAIEGDMYNVGSHNCSVRRVYIDWKMPLRLRKSWPVVIDKTGTIIYIPRYRKTFVDNHPSKFLIKIK